MCVHDTKSRLMRTREPQAGTAAERISACRTAPNARWQPLWFLFMAGASRGHDLVRGASTAQPWNFETQVVDGSVPRVYSQVADARIGRNHMLKRGMTGGDIFMVER